jgi:hypothetical protein
LKIPNKKRAGGVAQGVCPEFKPWCRKKKKKTPKKQKKTFTLEEKKEVHAEVGKKLEKGQCPPWG